MDVAIAPELESFVRSRIDAGLNASATEVVDEALRILAEYSKDRDARLQELRAEIRKGMEAGRRGEFTDFSAARLKQDWRKASQA